jgi:hypothetical protein
VDIHAGVIVDVEATAAHRTEENDATKKMIDRVEERFDLKPQRLIGDTAYGTAAMLNWLVNEKEIEPHVPVWDHTQRTDETTFPNSDFKWDEQRNEYRCPQGSALRTDWRPFKNLRSHITKDDAIIYRSRQSECDKCPMKPQCCPHTPIRKLRRSIHEAARDVARALAKTHRYKQSRNDRKKVEVLFAHLKRILKLDRLRLRGPSGAPRRVPARCHRAESATNGQAAMSGATKTRVRSHLKRNCKDKTFENAVEIANQEKSANPAASCCNQGSIGTSKSPSVSTE